MPVNSLQKQVTECGAYPRSVPPVALLTAATIFAADRLDLRLGQGALRRLQHDRERDRFAALAQGRAPNWSKTETLVISALSALLAARTSFSAGVSAATTKAKSRSMGWKGETFSSGRPGPVLARGWGMRSISISKADGRPLDVEGRQHARMQLAEAAPAPSPPAAARRSARDGTRPARRSWSADSRPARPAPSAEPAHRPWRRRDRRDAAAPPNGAVRCAPTRSAAGGQALILGRDALIARPDLEQRHIADSRAPHCVPPPPADWAARRAASGRDRR